MIAKITNKLTGRTFILLKPENGTCDSGETNHRCDLFTKECKAGTAVLPGVHCCKPTPFVIVETTNN